MMTLASAERLRQRFANGQRKFGGQMPNLLGGNLDGYQLGVAAGILDGLYGVFRRESSHNQCQLAVGCGLDGSPVNALNIFGSACAATVHFHKKLRVFHGFSSGLRTMNTDDERGGTDARGPKGTGSVIA
jgi:hypothetical protein